MIRIAQLDITLIKHRDGHIFLTFGTISLSNNTMSRRSKVKAILQQEKQPATVAAWRKEHANSK